MIHALISAVIIAPGMLGQQPSEQAAPTPAELVSKAMSRYYSAKTIKGTITLTQTAKGASGQLVTDLQIEGPAKFYLRQQKAYEERRTWLVTSDGKWFSYEAPEGFGRQNVGRLVEPINLKGKTLSYRDVYQAALLSIGDRSAMLDLIVGRREDLEYLRDHWVGLKLAGMTQLDGEDVYVISGGWLESGAKQPSGRFQLLINKDGDVRQYTIDEAVGLDKAGAQREIVRSDWRVEVTVNGPVDPKLFKVVIK